jgi:hypothetical protein
LTAKRMQFHGTEQRVIEIVPLNLFFQNGGRDVADEGSDFFLSWNFLIDVAWLGESLVKSLVKSTKS